MTEAIPTIAKRWEGQLMAELQRTGHRSVTVDAASGLTLLCPRPRGFEFLPGSPERSVTTCE